MIFFLSKMYLQIVIIIILIIIIFTIIAYYDSNKQFSSYTNKKEIKTKTNENNEDSEEEIDYDDTIWKSLNEPWWNQQIPIFIYSNNIYRGGGIH